MPTDAGSAAAPDALGLVGGPAGAVALGFSIARGIFNRRRRSKELRERLAEQVSGVVLGENPIPVVYGETIVGVRPSFIAVNPARGGGSIVTQVWPIACGAANGAGITDVTDIWFDGRPAVVGASITTGTLESLTRRGSSPRYVDGIVVDTENHTNFRRTNTTRGLGKDLAFAYRIALGALAQGVDTTLTADFRADRYDAKADPKVVWSDTDALGGIAYLVTDVYAGTERMRAPPSRVTMRVKGAPVYDPRTRSWGHSANPALCLRDYLLSDAYGCGMDADEVDDQWFMAAANFCDERVPIPGGGTAPRFRCGGALDTGDTLMNNIADLLTSCRGELLYQEGRARLFIPDVKPPHLRELTDDNIIGDIRYERANADVHNAYSVEFAGEGTGQVTPDLAVWPQSGASGVYLAEDGGRERIREISLPMTQDYDRALHIGMVLLNEERSDLSVSLTAHAGAIIYQVGDVVLVTHEHAGWARKPFWVRETVLAADGTVRLALREYDRDNYDISTREERPDTPSSALPDPFTVLPPSGLSLTSDASTSFPHGGADHIPAILAEWTASPDPYLERYDLEWRRKSESDYISSARPAGETERAYISPVEVGAAYIVRLRAVNHAGLVSAWVDAEVTVATERLPALGSFHLDRDGLELTLIPSYQLASSYRYAVRRGNDPGNPSPTEIRSSPVRTGASERTVHLLTEGSYEIVRVGVMFYRDAAGTESEGDPIFGVFTYDPAADTAPLPSLTFFKAAVASDTPVPREAVRAVATHPTRNVALYYRDYEDGTTPPSYARHPKSGYTTDPLEQHIEVDRPGAQDPDRIIEAFAEASDGSESGRRVVVVDAGAKPSCTVSLDAPAGGEVQAHVTVSTSDADTGSYRGRWSIDGYEDPAFADQYGEFSGGANGGYGNGPALNQRGPIGPTLETGDTLYVSIYAVDTTDTGRRRQVSAIRSKAIRASVTVGGDLPPPVGVFLRLASGGPFPFLFNDGAAINHGDVVVVFQSLFGAGVQSYQVAAQYVPKGGGSPVTLNQPTNSTPWNRSSSGSGNRPVSHSWLVSLPADARSLDCVVQTYPQRSYQGDPITTTLTVQGTDWQTTPAIRYHETGQTAEPRYGGIIARGNPAGARGGIRVEEGSGAVIALRAPVWWYQSAQPPASSIEEGDHWLSGSTHRVYLAGAWRAL